MARAPYPGAPRRRADHLDDHAYVVAESWPVAQAFFEAVCKHVDDDLDEIVVFSQGRFFRDAGLRRDIAGASLDDLVLPEGFVESLVEHTVKFFDSKPVYEAAGLAWRRGVLLLGDPGNGKTHSIKALLNVIGKPSVLVKDLDNAERSCEPSVPRLFRFARRFPASVMVFEDLDTLVTPRNRSALLNELDGFASNSGLLVLATANNPAKLDPALANRPSRFDRKLTFVAPKAEERRRYLLRRAEWLAGEAALEDLVKQSKGFSYAYLKELCVSGVVASMGLDGSARSQAWLDCAAALKKEVVRE